MDYPVTIIIAVKEWEEKNYESIFKTKKEKKFFLCIKEEIITIKIKNTIFEGERDK